MSAKLMGQVFDLDLPPNLAWVLMAYVDHADHEGRHIRPSLALIQYKTGYSLRQVSYATKQLCQLGLLIVERAGGGRGNPTEFRACFDYAPRKPERIRPERGTINTASRAGFAETLQLGAENLTQTLQGDAETNSVHAQNAREPLTVNRGTINDKGYDEFWELVREQLRYQLTKATWETWIRGTRLAAYDDDSHTATIDAGNPYAQQWLAARLRPMIERTLSSIAGQPMQASFIIAQEPHP